MTPCSGRPSRTPWSAGAGNDWLSGGSEGDRLEGGPGADRFYGDGEDDTLLGGADADTWYVPAHRRGFSTSRECQDVVEDCALGWV